MKILRIEFRSVWIANRLFFFYTIQLVSSSLKSSKREANFDVEHNTGSLRVKFFSSKLILGYLCNNPFAWGIPKADSWLSHGLSLTLNQPISHRTEQCLISGVVFQAKLDINAKAMHWWSEVVITMQISLRILSRLITKLTSWKSSRSTMRGTICWKRCFTSQLKGTSRTFKS